MATLDDTPQWVSSVSGVDNGDGANAEEFNLAPTQLAQRTSYLKQQIDSGTLTHADSAVGAETPSRIHGLGQLSNSKYWLIETATVVGGNNFMRIYRDVSRDGLLVFTFNAVWDAETSTWSRDSGSSTSLKLEVGLGLSGSTQSRGVAFSIASLGVTSGGWTDTDWDGGWTLGWSSSIAATFLALIGDLPAGNSPAANTLYANLITKASGSIIVSSSTITPLETANVDQSSLSLNGVAQLIVPFQTPMANTNYVVTPSPNASVGVPVVVSKFTTSFTFSYQDGAGGFVDLTMNTRTFDFVVTGKQ